MHSSLGHTSSPHHQSSRMHLKQSLLFTALTTLGLATAEKPPANPPTTPYIINFLAKWELQSLANESLAVSPASSTIPIPKYFTPPSPLPSTLTYLILPSYL